MIFIKIISRGIIKTVIDSEESLLKFLNDCAFKHSKIRCIRISKEFLDIAHTLYDKTLTSKQLAKYFKGEKQVHIRETYRLRGYTEEEAQADIYERQPNMFDPTVYAKRRNVSYEEAVKQIYALTHTSSRRCIEYWTSRGYTHEEAVIQVSRVQSENSKKFALHQEANPEKYSAIKPNQVGYYIKKGYSLEDAIQAVSEYQSTFSKEKCIARYGEEQGLIRFKQRQDKWLDTLGKLPDEEKDRIAHAKIKGKGSISKIEKKFVNELLKTGIDLQTQFKIRYNETVGISTKIYDVKINDVLIEFHGDYFHANPKTHPDLTHVKRTPVDVIRHNDKFKECLAIKNGFRFLVVWESDFKKFPNETIEKVLNFVKL